MLRRGEGKSWALVVVVQRELARIREQFEHPFLLPVAEFEEEG
jgi:hypothetical protein